jgi:hypothetical protein
MRHQAAHPALPVALALLIAPVAASAADGRRPEVDPAPSSTVETIAVSPPARRDWVVRVETSVMAMRDSWLGIPVPELGLTLGRDVGRKVSFEVTGSVREVDSKSRRSWSALAAARWAPVVTANGRHALTLAGGPLLEIDNVVHGTLPFAHTELAYIYRASYGLTILAGAGPNVALASSSYVTPPSRCAPDGDSFCLDLGPDAQELHAGDVIVSARLAAGWQF